MTHFFLSPLRHELPRQSQDSFWILAVWIYHRASRSLFPPLWRTHRDKTGEMFLEDTNTRDREFLQHCFKGSPWLQLFPLPSPSLEWFCEPKYLLWGLKLIGLFWERGGFISVDVFLPSATGSGLGQSSYTEGIVGQLTGGLGSSPVSVTS